MNVYGILGIVVLTVQLELISLSFYFNKIQICTCVFYRPPNSTRCIFDTLCSYLVSICANKFHNFVLLGDFNVNYDNESNPLHHDLCNLSSMFNISQVVVGPTHVHNNGSQLTIDLVFASNHIKVNSCETLPPLCNSDHYGVLTQIELRSSIHQAPCKGRLVWRYNYADWCLASNVIENTNWDLLFSEDNIELSWTSWKQRFMSIMKECIPNTTLRSRRNLPWLNKQLIQAMKRRNFEGRVEVCDNEWKTVCSRGWNDEEARVVCGQLGFPEDGRGQLITNSINVDHNDK